MALTLCSLPSDVLGLILTGVNVLQLWKCGNHAMNTKIALGVTKLHLRAVNRMKCLFPPIISQLRNLRHLGIFSSSKLQENPIDWVNTLKSLPQSLEFFDIDSTDVSHVFINYDLAQGYPSVILTNYERGPSKYVDIGSLFPRLNTLGLGQPIHDLDNFTALPSTLTALQANAVWSTMPGPVSLLPSSIRSICGAMTFEPTIEHWSQLSNLETFMLAQIVSVNTCNWLPRSITWFVHRAISDHLVWTHETAQTFPQGVTDCTLLYVNEAAFPAPSNWAAELPRGLTSFTFIPNERSELSLPLASLPTTLTYLRFNALQSKPMNIKKAFDMERGYSSDAIRAQWPPNLTVLLLPLFRVPCFDIDLLPHTLNWLRVKVSPPALQSVSPVPAIDASHFPPNLTRLGIGNSSGLSFKNNFPSKLYVFLLDTARESKLSPFDRTIESFPDSLRELHLFSCANCNEIPKLLTRFTACRLNFAQFGLLPRTLTSLTVERLEHFTNELATGSLFEDLPVSLTHVALSSNQEQLENFPPSQRLLNVLPSLIWLNLSKFEALPSSFIRELPRGLQMAQLNVDYLDPEDAPFLPPGLRMLTNTSKWTITPEIAECWPLGATGNLNEADFKLAEPRLRKHFH